MPLHQGAMMSNIITLRCHDVQCHYIKVLWHAIPLTVQVLGTGCHAVQYHWIRVPWCAIPLHWGAMTCNAITGTSTGIGCHAVQYHYIEVSWCAMPLPVLVLGTGCRAVQYYCIKVPWCAIPLHWGVMSCNAITLRCHDMQCHTFYLNMVWIVDAVYSST